MREECIYPGRDLEAMVFAYKYHRWILESFLRYMGKRLVEVGAGSGSFSELLWQLKYESLSLVEPSNEMYRLLEARVNNTPARRRIRAYNATFREVADEIRAKQQPDSIIYVNVLEHIKDDEAEIEVIYRTLCKRGRAFIFVPAFQWLFGEFDQNVGHFRRYNKRQLEDLCRRSGFKIISSRYFDFFGIMPWWLKYRFLKHGELAQRTVELHDRFVVPLTKRAERVIKPPMGKNIVLIAEKY